MKLLTNFLVAFLIITIVFLVIPTSGMAQIDPSCDPLDPTCPIDGGLTALLAIGVGYGIKKVRDSRKG